jgi:hypothetical protein
MGDEYMNNISVLVITGLSILIAVIMVFPSSCVAQIGTNNDTTNVAYVGSKTFTYQPGGTNTDKLYSEVSAYKAKSNSGTLYDKMIYLSRTTLTAKTLSPVSYIRAVGDGNACRIKWHDPTSNNLAVNFYSASSGSDVGSTSSSGQILYMGMDYYNGGLASLSTVTADVTSQDAWNYKQAKAYTTPTGEISRQMTFNIGLNGDRSSNVFSSAVMVEFTASGSQRVQYIHQGFFTDNMGGISIDNQVSFLNVNK